MLLQKIFKQSYKRFNKSKDAKKVIKDLLQRNNVVNPLVVNRVLEVANDVIPEYDTNTGKSVVAKSVSSSAANLIAGFLVSWLVTKGINIPENVKMEFIVVVSFGISTALSWLRGGLANRIKHAGE